MKTRSFVPAVLATVVVPAFATTTVFTTQPAFDAAAGPTVLEDLNSITTTAALIAGVDTPAGSVLVRHDGSDDTSFLDDGTGPNPVNATGYIDAFVAPEVNDFFVFPEERLTITLPVASTAFAFDYAEAFSSSNTGGVDVFADGVFVFNTRILGIGGTGTAVPATFLGFTSDTPFTTISFASPPIVFGETFGIDNLRYIIPTPASATLLAAGALFATRRRR